MCSIPGLGRCPGGGHGNPFLYSCLENPHGQWCPWGCRESDTTEQLSRQTPVAPEFTACNWVMTPAGTVKSAGNTMANLSHFITYLTDLETFLIIMVFNLDNLSWEFFLQDCFIHVPWIDPYCKLHLWVKTSLYSLTPKQNSMWHIISTYQNNSCLHHWA